MVSEEVLGRGAALAVLGEVDGAGPSGEAAALAKGSHEGGVEGAGGFGEAERVVPWPLARASRYWPSKAAT